jgi:hypothetical protein
MIKTIAMKPKKPPMLAPTMAPIFGVGLWPSPSAPAAEGDEANDEDVNVDVKVTVVTFPPAPVIVATEVAVITAALAFAVEDLEVLVEGLDVTCEALDALVGEVLLDVVAVVVGEGGDGLFGLEATAVHDVVNSVFTFRFVTETTVVSVT